MSTDYAQFFLCLFILVGKKSKGQNGQISNDTQEIPGKHGFLGIFLIKSLP